MNSQETTAVNTVSLRKAIFDIRNLLKQTDNKAAQAMARISADTLDGYLPENLRVTDNLSPSKKA